MKIMMFNDFLSSINESAANKFNKGQVLVGSILSTYNSSDTISTTAYRTLCDTISSELSKKKIDEVILAVAKKVDLRPEDLKAIINACKRIDKLKKEGTKNTAETSVKDNYGYLTGFRNTSDTRGVINDIKSYLKDVNDPKFAGVSKSNLTLEDIDAPFVKNLTLTTKGTNSRSSTYSLFSFNNADKDKEDPILDKVKSLDFGKDDTLEMIRIGLDNMNGVDLRKYDTIISPKSSSKILPLFANEVADFIDKQRNETGINKELIAKRKTAQAKINPVLDAFLKLPGKDIVWDDEAISKLIGDQKKEDTKKEVEKLRAKISGSNEGVSLSKQVRVTLRKFLLKFLELSSDGGKAVAKGKNILILDDFITGGNTVRHMRELVAEAAPGANVFALSIFKIEGAIKAEKDKQDKENAKSFKRRRKF